MKSSTKQDFIEENQEEEVIEIQRKIRVKILDPDATESSSDDEQEKKPKFIIHEIIQEKVKLQSFSLKSKNLSNFYQFSGKLPPMVRKRKCGKGAKNVRVKKEAIYAKSENGSSSSDPPLMVPPMVRKRKCGKLEEKLKVAKNVIVKEAISANSENGSSSGNLPLMVDSSSVKIQSFSGKLPPMVRKRKSGKFATEIRNPFSKKRIWLGTFDTAEEASKVYQSKKFEFQEMLKKAKNANVKKVISAKFELGSSSFSNPPLMVDSQTSLNVLDDQLNKAINANVKKAISAKYELGLMVDSQTSDSSNELGDQFKKAKNANVNKAISAKSELGSSSSDPVLILDEFDEQLKKAINANVKEVISAKSELGSSSSSDPSSLVVDSQTSDSSNVVEEKDDQESEEEMWMGQWIQISGDKHVKFSQKLGVPVVDNYGFLLGEFSKLDDLSISI